MKKVILVGCSIFITLNSICQKIDNSKLEYSIFKGDSVIVNNNRVFFKNVESLIVYLKGEIKFEKYYNGFNKDSVHQIQSQTKSIMALLMGIAIDKGYIKSENELVSKYFSDHFSVNDPLKSIVTIKDLLTMSAGFEWEEFLAVNDPKNDNMNMYRSGNWLNYALTRPMAKKPFTEFKYNSGLPMITAGIIEKATKMKLDEFANKYLFEPLQIKKFRWQKDSNGFCHAGGGLYLKPMDMMKIGILVLNSGKLENRQLISESWIKKAISSYLSTSIDNSTYGYFWWIREMKLSNGKTTKVITAEGYGGQKLYLFPEYKLIIAFTEQNFNTPQVGPMFINESILPILN
ncbi:MAG: serine hydrolase domain-containing protein [Tenuifilaceae bacterium]